MLLLQVISPIIVILSLWSCNCICKLVHYTVIVQFYDAMNSVYLSYDDIEIGFDSILLINIILLIAECFLIFASFYVH